MNKALVYGIVTTAGIIGSNVLTYFATKKATIKIKDIEDKTGEKVPTKQKIKMCWKEFIAPVAVVVATSAAVTGTKVSDVKTQATMAATIAGVKKGYDKYGKTIKEYFDIEDREEKKDFDRIILKNSEPKPDPDQNKTRYYLGWGYDDYFLATDEEIEAAEAMINRQLRCGQTVSVADVLDSLGLKPNDATTTWGWGAQELFNDVGDSWLTIDYEVLDDNDGQPTRMICFTSVPEEGFEESDKLYKTGSSTPRDVPFNT